MEIMRNNERYMIVKDSVTRNLYLLDKEALKFSFINETSTKKKRERKGNFINEYKIKSKKKENR
ncbi:hypothetical protein [Fusobacterium varium]|uniref:hypothetical protein n=1 Tax=Fusobacterium varium TaxID=856 RepID=UPI00242AE37E|nr:hypothetical protein [Fusobacterium varium]